jgi:hypothetical protein
VAALAAENIDPGDDESQYAWGENVGWLNVEPDNCSDCGVQVTNTGLTGYMWGENIGWINLSCQNNGTCGGPAVNWGVTNDNGGNLKGYAWGENVGWISFSCKNTKSCGGAWYGVDIDPLTGVFSGYAWGENIGWINFSLGSQAAYQVETSWRSPCTPGSDTDGDGWKDEDEWYITTDCLDSCPEDATDDALPPDNNNDKDVNILDLLNYKPKLVGAYDRRYDLNTDAVIDVLDILLYKPELAKPWPCT